MKRRHFLAAGSVGAVVAAGGPAVAGGRWVDPQHVAYFTRQLAGHTAADMFLDPRDLIRTVAEQYRLVTGLARGADSPVRDDLTRVGAAYAVLAGWLHQDVGEWGEARAWHSAALAEAQTVADPDLQTYVLANLSYLHVEAGDGRAAVGLCERGLALPGAPAVARMQLIYQQAHGYSVVGNRAAVDRLLDAAEATARSGPEQPPAPWSRTAASTNPLFFDIQRATCYGRLGLHARARPLWERVVAGVPGGARRRVGVYLARQAIGYAVLGEPDHAVELAAESARIATETGSVRHRRELEVLRRTMEPWATGSRAEELVHALSPISGR
ncbi:Twin-arginine translocation pathway signal [Streptomyces sp. NPDC020875]|uniref:Twin-arginine translocation pathway signal n=1 Tax=Streptomyces sp. NPDC020875 TaxID=3154898 RepID=UPI0034057697